MLDSVRETITATAVNKRGHVDIVSLHRKDGATQIVFRASPAQSVIFPAMIDQPALARIRSGLIQELMLAYGLRPMWADEQGDEIRWGCKATITVLMSSTTPAASKLWNNQVYGDTCLYGRLIIS